MRLPVIHVLSDRDADLVEHGWTRRFVAAPPRLQEVADLYRELGHEVRLEPVRQDELGSSCEDCALALSLFRTVYTREKP
jgi:hypothetical protein